MNVKKKVIAVMMASLFTAGASANNMLDLDFGDDQVDQVMEDIVENVMVEDNTAKQTLTNKTRANHSESLLFDAQDSIKKARDKMALEEENNTLDLKIDIATKKNELAVLETADKVANLMEEINLLEEDIEMIEDELSEAEDDLTRKDNEIARLKQREMSLMHLLSQAESKTIEESAGLESLTLTRTSLIGNDKEATVLYGFSVIKRRVGEKINGTITIKEINFDNIVVSNGHREKTIYILHENIAEGNAAKG